MAIYEKEATQKLKELNKILRTNQAPRFFQNKHCTICEFRLNCTDKLIESDDLSLLPRMPEKEVLKQNNKGIFTILQYSYTFRPRRKRKYNHVPQKFEPALKALAIREQKTFIKEVPKLPKSKIEIFVDFEGLPNEKFIYLIGCIIQRGEKSETYSFWADKVEQEVIIFKQFFDLLNSFEDYRIFHYGSYEVQNLKRIIKKYDVFEKKITSTVFGKMINLLSFFYTNIYPPTYSNSLKEIGRFLGFQWSITESSGIMSVVWRKDWENKGSNFLKEKIRTYNYDDCRATLILRNFVDTVQNSAHLTSELPDIRKFKRFNSDKSIIPEFDELIKCAYFDYLEIVKISDT